MSQNKYKGRVTWLVCQGSLDKFINRGLLIVVFLGDLRITN